MVPDNENFGDKILDQLRERRQAKKEREDDLLEAARVIKEYWASKSEPRSESIQEQLAAEYLSKMLSGEKLLQQAAEVAKRTKSKTVPILVSFTTQNALITARATARRHTYGWAFDTELVRQALDDMFERKPYKGKPIGHLIELVEDKEVQS